MCNLYRMRTATQEVGQLLGAAVTSGLNVGTEVYPGYPGLVVAKGAVRQMTWGFPLVLTGKQGQKLRPKPVNNAREDKLQTPFWRDSFATRRCLIPVSEWAEAEGEKGRMTRTWYGLPDGDLFAVAGIWRPTAEWGAAYAMVMVDGCAQMAEVHDRMPVLLPRSSWTKWSDGTPDEAFGLCQTWAADLMVERTQDRWAGPRAPTPPAHPLL